MTIQYKLAIIPEGYKVVPEDALRKLTYSFDSRNEMEKLLAAPPIDTPPVLRWEGLFLKCANIVLCHVRSDGSKYGWSESLSKPVMDRRDTLQEARLAAQKALGFPDGLVIDESN